MPKIILRRAPTFTLALFAASLAIRLLFLFATPDRAWPDSAYYKGDAPVWMEYAAALRSGEPFEYGLPLRPPAMAYVLDLLWDGTPRGIEVLKIVWCVLGALVPVVFAIAAGRAFGPTVGRLVGAGTAVATGLLLLTTSLNNETPSLLLTGLALLAIDEARRRPGALAAGAWSALGAISCLFRVEHLLFYLVGTAFLLGGWWKQKLPPPRWVALLVILFLGFLLPLVPWHLHAWRGIDRFNTTNQDLGPEIAEVTSTMERLGGNLAVEPDAEVAFQKLPAFGRAYWRAFVLGTVAYRGGTTVRSQDVGILEEAFGTMPAPIPSRPFVTLYGPLNFHLANNSRALPGFSRDALDDPPPLQGGNARYAPRLVSNLPPVDGLSFAYPPHLRAVSNGYALGMAWMRANPAAFLRLAAKRLAIFWEGAALGVTGYSFPLGLEGLRRRVDLLTPEPGPGTLAWQVAVASAALAGLAAAWRRAAILPWLFYFATKALAAALFFGYARLGASAIPVVVLLGALAADRFALRRLKPSFAAILVAALLAGGVLAEALRFMNPPEVSINGRLAGAEDPYPPLLYLDMPVTVRFR